MLQRKAPFLSGAGVEPTNRGLHAAPQKRASWWRRSSESTGSHRAVLPSTRSAPQSAGRFVWRRRWASTQSSRQELGDAHAHARFGGNLSVLPARSRGGATL